MENIEIVITETSNNHKTENQFLSKKNIKKIDQTQKIKSILTKVKDKDSIKTSK